MPWYWLSFVDPDLPEGSQFLGVCIVDGDDPVEAVKVAWAAKCNPGGEVLTYELERLPTAAPRYELLSHDRLVELGLAD